VPASLLLWNSRARSASISSVENTKLQTPRKKCCRWPRGGPPGAMRTIARSMPPRASYACAWQGRRRPTPNCFTAGEVIDFSLVVICGLKMGSVCPRQGCREPAPRCYAAGAGGVTTVQTCVGGVFLLLPTNRTRRRYIAARDIAASLYICRVVLLVLRQYRGAADLGEL
jgi:hypothetical protein